MGNNVENSNASAIRSLNDQARKSFTGATMIVTHSFQSLSADIQAKALSRVQNFDTFDHANDPYEEHDFGCFEEGGQHFFFKFSYYDRTMKYGSKDPSDEQATVRILTVGLLEDY